MQAQARTRRPARHAARRALLRLVPMSAGLACRSPADSPDMPTPWRKRVSPRNTLSRRRPAIAGSWHPTHNSTLTPADVSVGSGVRAWWRCRADPGHEWQAPVADRTRGKGCPYCAGKKTAPDQSLAVRLPKLARQWHPTLNGRLTPKDVIPGSARRIWWRCPNDAKHEWRAFVFSRAKGGTGCPFCAGQVTSPEYNLAVGAPEIALQWHSKRNRGLTPHDVTPGSNRPVWWRCRQAPDHEWVTTPNMRTSRKSGCPFCSGRRLSATNCFAARQPRLAAQWHPTLNRGVTPYDVFSSSNGRVWWRCERGHAWLVSVNSRVKSQSGCPACNLKRRRPVTTRRIREVVHLPSDWS